MLAVNGEQNHEEQQCLPSDLMAFLLLTAGDLLPILFEDEDVKGAFKTCAADMVEGEVPCRQRPPAVPGTNQEGRNPKERRDWYDCLCAVLEERAMRQRDEISTQIRKGWRIDTGWSSR